MRQNSTQVSPRQARVRQCGTEVMDSQILVGYLRDRRSATSDQCQKTKHCVSTFSVLKVLLLRIVRLASWKPMPARERNEKPSGPGQAALLTLDRSHDESSELASRVFELSQTCPQIRHGRLRGQSPNHRSPVFELHTRRRNSLPNKQKKPLDF